MSLRLSGGFERTLLRTTQGFRGLSQFPFQASPNQATLVRPELPPLSPARRQDRQARRHPCTAESCPAASGPSGLAARRSLARSHAESDLRNRDEADEERADAHRPAYILARPSASALEN